MALQFNPFTGTFDVTTKGDTGAVAAAGDGTAAAPGITFASDTNTGIYRPGEDQVAVATNGTGRLFVDGSGNLGVGTNLPGSIFHVFSNNPICLIEEADQSANSRRWGIQSESSILKFRAFNDAMSSAVDALHLTRTGTVNIVGAGTAGSTQAVSFNGSAPVNSLVVDSSGRLGVGTSSPAYGLEVNNQDIAITNRPSTGTGNPVLYLRRNVESGDANVVSTHGTIAFQTDYALNGTFATSSSILAGSTGDSNNTYLAFSTTSSGGTLGERMRLTSTGLGIGTTSPGDRLELQGGDFRISANSVQYHKIAYVSNDFVFTANAGAVNQSSNFVFSSSTAGGAITERARIDSSGRLLVGTSTNSGGALLQVNGDRIRVGTAKTPASATDTGTAGEICWDSSYVYVCTATNTWKRSALSTW